VRRSIKLLLMLGAILVVAAAGWFVLRNSETATAAQEQDRGEQGAQRDLARHAAIVNTQLAVTRQQYDTQKALVDQLAASVQADQAQTMPRS